jgi:hypothetical protein
VGNIYGKECGEVMKTDYKLAYIAGAYRAPTPHEIKQNIRMAEAVAIKYLQKGYAVICPHKNTALLDGVIPDEEFLKMYLAILFRCDVCVMMDGWKKSEGARKEHEFASQNGIWIIYDRS